MTPTSHIVVADDVRPARPDGMCFYCRVPVGGEHAIGCVCRRKTVVVDVTFRMVRKVPEDWSTEEVEFHLNESSLCASSFLDDLQSVDTEEFCLCDRATGKFIREATAEDEIRYGICTP